MNKQKERQLEDARVLLELHEFHKDPKYKMLVDEFRKSFENRKYN